MSTSGGRSASRLSSCAGTDGFNVVSTVTFQPLGEETEMVVEIRCSSAEHLAQFVQRGVADGTARTVDNLVARAERLLAA